jgi:hypothetical protein
MTVADMHKVWVEQCDATATIKERFGVQSAFDYLVAEKLTNFADAAQQRPDFARELPKFVSEVRRIFSPREIRDQFGRVQRMEAEQDLLDLEPREEDEYDDVLEETPACATERLERFALIKQLLLAAQLGTS